MGYEFLSDEWFQQVDALNGSAGELDVPPAIESLTVNVHVTGLPSGGQTMCIRSGLIQKLHDSSAQVTLTVPVDLACRLFVHNDQSAGVQGFMAGQIKVEGDLSQLMAMQSAQLSSQHLALQEHILAITDDPA